MPLSSMLKLRLREALQYRSTLLPEEETYERDVDMMDDETRSRLLQRLWLHPGILSICHFAIMSLFSHTIILIFLSTTVALFLPLPWGGGFATGAYGQEPPPNRPSVVRCASPANPHKLYRECAGQPFDVIEHTLTADWVGLRSELQRLGITPTASYITQLMGNPSG